MKTMASQRLLLALLALATASAASKDEAPSSAEEKRASARLPPCAACSNLAGSFDRASEKAASKGEADRLEHILNKLVCRDVERGEAQCRENKNEWERKLREWYNLPEADKLDLREWLCVDALELCCPEDRFGPECRECQVRDSRGRMCSGNGKCKGAGTRKGNGACACDPGYGGALCADCAAGYYESYRDEEKALCSQCHKSCLAHCTGAGAKGCVACRSGYGMDAEHGCADVDECAVSAPCAGNKFCVNTEGAFRCVNCDKACDGCDGDGPDNCRQCAEGYTMRADSPVCISEQTASRIFSISNTRFFTYAGLCIAAAIIFQRSVAVAGVLGAVIAGYITLSEFYLMNSTGDLRPI